MTGATDRQARTRAPRVVRLAREDDFDGWRDAARRLAGAGVPPEAVVWQVGESGGLFGEETGLPSPTVELRVPHAFVDLAQSAALHSEPERFGLLYTLLWRISSDPRIVEDHADPLVRRGFHAVRSLAGR